MTRTKLLWQNDFVELRESNNSLSGIAIAKTNYIPIENFKEAFLKASFLANLGKWNYFIFDKSNLDTFHQPSMEWYYTNWKRDLVKKGVNKHFKILPELPWFETSVKAGLHEIKLKNPNFDFSAFSVTYFNNLKEALKEVR